MKPGNIPAAHNNQAFLQQMFQQGNNDKGQGVERSRRPGTAGHPGKHLGQMKKANQGLPQADQNLLQNLLLSLLNQQTPAKQTSEQQPAQQAPAQTTVNVPVTTPSPDATNLQIANSENTVDNVIATTTPANAETGSEPITTQNNTTSPSPQITLTQNPLNLSTAEQVLLHQILNLDTAPNNPQISQILDSDSSGNLNAGDTVVSQRQIEGTLTDKNHILTDQQVQQFIDQGVATSNAPALPLSAAQEAVLKNDYQLRNVTISDSNGDGQINTGDRLNGTKDPDPLRFFDETNVQFDLTSEMVNKLLLT